MFSKARLKEAVLRFSGITAYQWARLPDGVYCFNYHRIGDPLQTQFDPNVFSCTAESFKRQLRFFKQHFQLINLHKLQQLIDAPAMTRGKYALITFDDGYMDNYELALPLLQQEQVQAVFFVSPDFVGSQIVPWWDQVAWWLRHSSSRQVSLAGKILSLQPGNSKVIAESIRQLLALLKADPRELNVKLAELYQQLKPEQDVPADCRLFMGWPELKQLLQSGMSIGSHTCGHQILSHLSSDEQRRELSSSKEQLEQELATEISALAYPVGDEHSYTPVTQQLASSVGYKLAFSFTNSYNLLPLNNPLAISRLGIDSDMSVFQLQKKIAFAKQEPSK